MRQCEACGGSLEGTHPSKRFCDDKCRKRGARGARVTPLRPEPESLTVSVGASTWAALVAADRADTPAGAAAMVLARRLDGGGDTGSAIAALAKAHREALAEAVAGSAKADDQIDEFTRRRRERHARASGA